MIRSTCEVRTVTKSVPAQQTSSPEDDGWGVDGEDWGGEDGVLDCLVSNNITDDLDKLTITETETNTTGFVDQNITEYFNPYYMYVMEEPKTNNKGYKKYEVDEAEPSSGSREKYEQSEVKDRDFYKFYKKIQLCPEQCIRYDLGGVPSLIPQDLSIPPCSVCRSPRQFECQLMPALISVLKVKHSRRNVLDFRTVLVFTCSKDCNELSRVSEFVVCVPEPEVKIPHKGGVQSGS